MILISGATGTVGSEVIKRLSARGVQVRALTRDPRKADANRLPHVQFVQGDFEDVDSMRRACSGVDRAFLLTNSTERTEHLQIVFTRVAQQSGVRHIVKLSQLHADTDSPGRFLRYHAAVEAAVQASGLTFTFLRPNIYMQGLLNFRQSIQEKSAFFAAAGGARISAVDVRDLADLDRRQRSLRHRQYEILNERSLDHRDSRRSQYRDSRGSGVRELLPFRTHRRPGEQLETPRLRPAGLLSSRCRAKERGRCHQQRALRPRGHRALPAAYGSSASLRRVSADGGLPRLCRSPRRGQPRFSRRRALDSNVDYEYCANGKILLRPSDSRVCPKDLEPIQRSRWANILVALFCTVFDFNALQNARSPSNT